MKLQLKDFRVVFLTLDLAYYQYKTAAREVCLEPCLNGYDVALYDKDQNLLLPKKCLNLNIEEHLVSQMEHKAVDTANEMLNAAIEDGIIDGTLEKVVGPVTSRDCINHLFYSKANDHVTYGGTQE